jgi:hypothetical protein
MRKRTAQRADRRPGRDAGVSLIETVIAITLTGLVIIPVMAAVRTGITSSVINEGAANAETAVVDAADRINRAPQSCDYSVFAQASVQTKGWDPSRAKVSHQYYDPVLNVWQDGGCRFAAPTADLVQKITITITPPTGEVSRSIQVVKSNV